MAVTSRSVSPSQRFGVWKAWKGRCFWCEEPVYFKDCHIDHFLPSSAVSDMARLKERYSLPSDFDFNNFENWVPAHPSCNQRKRDILIDPSPEAALLLQLIRMNARIAACTAQEIDKDRKKAPLLAKLQNALEAGDITKPEIEGLFRNLPVIIRKGYEVADDHIQLAPGWKIIEDQNRGNVVVVRT